MAGISTHVGVIICVCILIGLFLFALHIWWVERGQVYNMPRKPMKLCDIHGAYPAEASMYIDALQDGRQDLRVELCPICYHDRQKEALANARK